MDTVKLYRCPLCGLEQEALPGVQVLHPCPKRNRRDDKLVALCMVEEEQDE